MRGSKRRVPRPIKDVRDVVGSLDERMILGFGGVAEYGSRCGGTRIFWTSTIDPDAPQEIPPLRRRAFRRHRLPLTTRGPWASITSPSPPARDVLRWCRLKNNLARGMRQASDFLMGSAILGRLQEEHADQSASESSRGGHRRRIDGDRHGHGVDGLLRGASGTGARAL